MFPDQESEWLHVCSALLCQCCVFFTQTYSSQIMECRLSPLPTKERYKEWFNDTFTGCQLHTAWHSLSSKPIITLLTKRSRNAAAAVQEFLVIMKVPEKCPSFIKDFLEPDNVLSHHNAVLNVSHAHLIMVPMYFVWEHDRISIHNTKNLNLSSPEWIQYYMRQNFRIIHNSSLYCSSTNTQ